MFARFFSLQYILIRTPATSFDDNLFLSVCLRLRTQTKDLACAYSTSSFVYQQLTSSRKACRKMSRWFAHFVTTIRFLHLLCRLKSSCMNLLSFIIMFNLVVLCVHRALFLIFINLGYRYTYSSFGFLDWIIFT